MTTIDEWIEALESGRYPKGKHRLYQVRTGTYCCLGVLADLDGALDHADGHARWGDGHETEMAYGGTGEMRAFLKRHDVTLMDLNDVSDTFDPVVAEIRRLYAEWKAEQ